MSEIVPFPMPRGAEARLFDNWVRDNMTTDRLNINFKGLHVGADIEKGVTLSDALREIVKVHDQIEGTKSKQNIDSGIEKTSIGEFLK